MKDTLNKYLLWGLILGVLFAGHFYVQASEVDTGEAITEEGTQEGISSEHRTEETSTENMAEETTESSSSAEEERKQPAKGLATQTDGERFTEQGISEATTEKDSYSEETQKALEELLKGLSYENGLPYFLNKYQYDCKAAYLKKYVAYMDAQIKAYQEMYELGEVTEDTLNSYKAQKALTEAELQTAQNESAYYNLYLTENNLDYSDYNVKSLKDMENIEYYRENYPEKDYMTIARYVTDYNNAVTYINAKQAEVNFLKKSLAMSKMLLDEGELSKIEYMEREVTLANAEYELEQYYVSMNIAYVNIESYCK